MFVGAHARQNDEILLPALEGIYTGNLHFLNETVFCQSQASPSLSCLFLQVHRRSCIINGTARCYKYPVTEITQTQ